MKKYILFVLLFTWSIAALAQVKISGKVTDSVTGEALSYLTVLVKGSNNTTMTDDNGAYSITVPDQNAVLVFSMIGYTTKEEVCNRTVIDVALAFEAQQLSDVVIVGYSSKKVSNITGTVSTVDAKKIESAVTANFTQALQGAAPGLQVTVNSGNPTAGSTMLIRGIGSINASNNPLCVVDGVPSPNADFSSMNPNDIESVSILKDASATSIYGSRGSNGVILITTKRGKSGETNIQFSSRVSVMNRTGDELNLMNAKEKLAYEKMLGVGKGSTMTNEAITGWTGPDTNWESLIFRTGITQQYDLSIAGGNDKTRLFLSGQYYNVKGISIGSDMERYTGRINVDHDLRKWITIGAKLDASYYDASLMSEASNGTNPFYNVFAGQPYLSPYNADGSYYKGSDLPSGINIFEYISTTPQYTQKLQLNSGIYANIKFNDQLSFKTNVGIEYGNRYIYQYSYPDATISTVLGTNGTRYDGYARSTNIAWTNLLTYRNTFADVHNVTAIAGVEWLDYSERNTTAQADFFATSKIDAIGTGAKPDAPSGSSSGYAMLSYLSNVSYAYDSKYLVDASLRFDGSSRLSPTNRWATFWSVGLGWNMHREAFMEGSRDYLSALKLAVNYGTQGNLPTSYYGWQQLTSAGNYNGQTTLYLSNVGNDELTWEKSDQVSLSINSSWFNNRLKVDVDLFHRLTRDLIYPVDLSLTTGQGPILSNIGKLRNMGIEVLARGELIQHKDHNLNLSVTFTTSKNEIAELYQDAMLSGMYIRQVGYSLGQYHLVRYAGVNPATGEALYYDKNGNPTPTLDANDAVILEGKTNLPKYYGSVDLSYSWKRLSATASIYYSIGSWVYNSNRMYSNSDGYYTANRNQDRDMIYKAWQKPGDITDIPKQSLSNVTYINDRFLENNSYCRLRNVTVSYTLPEEWVQKLYLRNVRCYVSAENLFTISGYKGFDPEVQGDDLNHYPVSRNISLGLTLNF